jgi:hypothetical protein
MDERDVGGGTTVILSPGRSHAQVGSVSKVTRTEELEFA